jgi:hypothetical protein
MKRLRYIGLLAGLGVIASWLGCSSSDEPTLPARHPVQGKVMYRGQPAKGFRVTYHPLSDIGPLQFAPSAITADDGSYRLQSYQPDDGAPLGDYAVTIEWPNHLIAADDPDPKPVVDQLRGAYSSPQRSKFKVSVVAGPNDVAPFVLQ